jgi:hypothetical protein
VGPSPHLTEELAVTDPILAIDLGKYKSETCLYDPATAEAAFLSYASRQVYLRAGSGAAGWFGLRSLTRAPMA